MQINGHIVKTFTDCHKLLLNKSVKVTDLVEACWNNVSKYDHLNAFVSKRDQETTMQEAEEAQKRYNLGQPNGVLDGMPISIKDNIFVKGMQASAASKALKGFIAPVDATTTARLRQKKVIIMGTANMDEFGMGSYGE